MVADTAQTEQIVQLETMIDSSPQVEKQSQLATLMHTSPNVAAQRKLNDMMLSSPRQADQRKTADRISNSPAAIAQLKKHEGLFGTAQLKPITQSSGSGLPDNLKSGIENLSGMSMDGVKVHYNSSEPAQLNAHAYAQGTDIHVAPGQEQHLPHEAWHIVQQAQGRVKPTMQMKDGVPVNDDTGLEHEADVMGSKALQMKKPTASTVPDSIVIQARFFSDTATQSGELSKDAFLLELQNVLQKTADEELAAIRQTSSDCPYIAKWFAHYQGKDTAYIQKAIARYAPDTESAQDIQQYIDLLAARVRQGLKEHVATGSTEAVPQELVEEKHAPEDFVHIANQETAQLGKLCNCGSADEEGQQAPPAIDFAGKYATATAVSAIYDNVRYFVDTDGRNKIIKGSCPAHEIASFQKMSGTAHFPRCYGGGNGYVLIDFIGDYPQPAATANAGNISGNLAQAAALCQSMAAQGIAHEDLDNNMLFHGGQLMVIDFGAIRETNQGSALNTNKSFIKRFLSNAEQVQFDLLC